MTQLKEIFYLKLLQEKLFQKDRLSVDVGFCKKNISVSNLDEAIERKNHNIQAVNPAESAETDEALPPPDGLSAVFVTIAQVIPGHQAHGGEVVIDIDRHPTFGSNLVDFPTNMEGGDQLVFPKELIAQSQEPPLTEQPEKHFREQLTKDPQQHLTVQSEEQLTTHPEEHLTMQSEDQLTKYSEEQLTVRSDAQLTKELEEDSTEQSEERLTEESEKQLMEQSVGKFTSNSEDQLTELSKGQPLELSEKQLIEHCEERLTEQPEELWAEHRKQTQGKPEDLVTERSEEQKSGQTEESLTELTGELWTEHSKQSEGRPEELLFEQTEEQTAEQREDLLTEQPEKLWPEHNKQSEGRPEELLEEQTTEQTKEPLTEQPENLWSEHWEKLEEPDQLDEHLLKQSEKQLVEDSKHLSQSQAGEAKHMPWEIVCKGDVCSLVKLRKN